VSITHGKNVSVKGKGKIKLLSNNIESSVLYVPSFPFQLLSIGKFSRTLNYHVIFYSQQVLFQDLATKKTISEGFFFKELYYFSSHPQNNKYCEVSAFSSFHQEQHLWHQHLAHPSNIVLAKLIPNLDIKNIPCDTCHLSKSTRLPFMLLSSKANKMFDLVHFDVGDQLLNLLMATNILSHLLMTFLVLLGFIS